LTNTGKWIFKDNHVPLRGREGASHGSGRPRAGITCHAVNADIPNASPRKRYAFKIIDIFD